MKRSISPAFKRDITVQATCGTGSKQLRHTHSVRALGIALLIAVALGTAAAPGAEVQSAKLQIVGLTPIAVSGARFRPGERVRVVLTADGTYVRTVRANRGGTFVARFGAVYADLCMRFQLRALGASGSRAVAARKTPPSCAAPDPIP
jgi:hypothetical protein